MFRPSQYTALVPELHAAIQQPELTSEQHARWCEANTMLPEKWFEVLQDLESTVSIDLAEQVLDRAQSVARDLDRFYATNIYISNGPKVTGMWITRWLPSHHVFSLAGG